MSRCTGAMATIMISDDEDQTMKNTATRKVVKIDENKCTGCGLCVPGCAEGAIQIIDGKARLVAENLCDGLGNCLGECPEGAITIEERPADAFDPKAVEKHLAGQGHAKQHAHGGCPGTMLRMLGAQRTGQGRGATGCPSAAPRKLAPRAGAAVAADSTAAAAPAVSQLGQWPVQLALVPTGGPIWQDADVLIAADCVPFAMPDFHARLLAGKTLAIACPKLDDVEPYIEKLAEIFANNTVRSITVAHMEVPCCGGIVYAVNEALDRAGRKDLPAMDITVGIDGTVQE